jgi:hypothetical protein
VLGAEGDEIAPARGVGTDRVADDTNICSGDVNTCSGARGPKPTASLGGRPVR